MSAPMSPLRTATPLRALTVTDLALTLPVVGAAMEDPIAGDSDLGRRRALATDHPLLERVKGLISDGFGGVILSGPPGTSKTWFAEQIAMNLVGSDPARVRFVQFHPSYQYEDFVEGYVPTESGGFALEAKHLLKMCEAAEASAGAICVIVIDELSRSEPARVFGEALTYIEGSNRGKEFTLSSGTLQSIPENLFIIATMNTFDRGVEEVEIAFDRRFGRIELPPDRSLLRDILSENDVSDDLRDRLLAFFDVLQRSENMQCRIGHAYFNKVRDEASLKRLWENQLSPHLQRANRFDAEAYRALVESFEKLVAI